MKEIETPEPPPRPPHRTEGLTKQQLLEQLLYEETMEKIISTLRYSSPNRPPNKLLEMDFKKEMEEMEKWEKNRKLLLTQKL